MVHTVWIDFDHQKIIPKKGRPDELNMQHALKNCRIFDYELDMRKLWSIWKTRLNWDYKQDVTMWTGFIWLRMGFLVNGAMSLQGP